MLLLTHRNDGTTDDEVVDHLEDHTLLEHLQERDKCEEDGWKKCFDNGIEDFLTDDEKKIASEGTPWLNKYDFLHGVDIDDIAKINIKNALLVYRFGSDRRVFYY